MIDAVRAWASLSMYESNDLVKRFAQHRTGRTPNTTKAREISAHFAQGREYFRNAEGAGELVRPLILYYGAVALARGAVLFLDTAKSKLEGAHGLDASGWGDLLTKPRSLPDSGVKIESCGTLPELARVTGNTEWVRVAASQAPGVADAKSPGSDLAPGTNLTVKEILDQIPDVARMYERTFQEHSRRLRAEIEYTGGPELRADNAPPPDKRIRRGSRVGILSGASPLSYPPDGWAAQLLKDGPCGTLYDGTPEEERLWFGQVYSQGKPGLFGRTHNLAMDAGSKNDPHLRMPAVTAATGEHYLKLPTDEGVVLSTLLALHLAAYATGMLVRYHPGYWSMLVGRREGSEIAPLLSAAVSTVEERYPTLILEAIGG